MAADASEAAYAEAAYAEGPYAEVSSAGVPAPTPLTPDESLAGRQIALIDLLDRLLNGGAVLTGDVVLSIADVDLVHINLRAVIRSITPDDPAPW
ncbi:gas vesicle protein [Streptomyces platensis]|nr:gas vesicle protein [Streptomyces platensis]